MKKTLLLCIGLTIIISIILIKLYSASVVSFINDTPEEDPMLTQLDLLPPVLTNTSSDGEEEVEEKIPFKEYDDEYMDTLVIDNETVVVRVNPTYVYCVVAGDQKISENIPVKFRIPENIEVNEKFIPANTVVYAMPDINEEEIDLKINSFHTTKGFVIQFMKAFRDDLNDEIEINEYDERHLVDGDTILFEY